VAATEPCPYCFHDVRVTWWDHVIGLAVRCPSCGASSGPNWTGKRLLVVAIGGLFVNALILFLVTRPLRALFLIGVYVASIATLLRIAAAIDSEPLTDTAMVCLLLGPIVLACIEFFWHASALQVRPSRVSLAWSRERPPPPPPFLGTNAQERIRNELEIAIFHATDQLELTAKFSYFAAFLNGVLAALSARWLDLIISLLVVGIAYTAKTHESRLFASLYTLLGFLLAGLMAHRLTGSHAETSELSVPVVVTFLAVGMLGECLWLARLRRARSRILLEPAEHLRD
jgi:hypothetical protein